MKHAKKMVGLLLALVMILSMSLTAFAADTYTYEIYQIFTGDFAGGVLSNVKWGKNAANPGETAVAGEAVPDAVLEELTAVNSKSDSEKLAVIEKYVNLASSGTEVTLTKEADGSYQCSGLASGYYLIKDKGTITGNDVATTYVAQVTDGTLVFHRKGTVPEVDKKIVDNGEVEVNEASIGDTVNFKITGTLPSNLDDYKEYTYIFTDTLSKGLTYNDGTVKAAVVNSGTETDVTKYFYVKASGAAEDETTLKVGISDLKALKNSTNPAVTLTSASQIVVTYSATLNEKAVIAGDGNDNKVKLAYSNDPNNSGDGTQAPPPENPQEPTDPNGETPEKTTKTYTTELTISKVDDRQQVLTGAEFTLSGNGVNVVVITGEVFTEDNSGTYWKLKDGTYTTDAPAAAGGAADDDKYESTTIKYAKKTEAAVVNGAGTSEKSVSAFVNDKGEVTFTGLGAGTYTITETVTPAGYNTIAPISFTLTFHAETLKFVSDNENIAVEANNTLSAVIENHPGSMLPSTGGMGTTIFYVVGAVLVIGAGALLIIRSRRNREN